MYILLDSTFILKSYHNFESYQNMLIILGFCVLYHYFVLFLVCHAHCTPFTCGKGLLKKIYFQIPYLLNCECSLNVGSRLLSSRFFTINFFLKNIPYLVLGKINHNLMQHLFKFKCHLLKPKRKF